jgi:hypothetical protein
MFKYFRGPEQHIVNKNHMHVVSVHISLFQLASSRQNLVSVHATLFPPKQVFTIVGPLDWF